MSFAKVHSAQITLLSAHIIDIEIDISKGLHAFSIVGLPDKGVEESKDRVSAAIKNSGFKSPKQRNYKTIISLAPSHIKKEGPAFDVGIALAYLLACKDISFNPEQKIFIGELTLNGLVRPVRGILSLIQKAKADGFKEVYLPEENAEEAALIKGITIYPVTTLAELIAHINTQVDETKPLPPKISPQSETIMNEEEHIHITDMSDIKGQQTAKRGLEIAAAGRHNIALFGPPGTGKTMLAKAFSGILPTLSFDEMLEVISIHSIAGISQNLSLTPPFRSPHHTSSYVSIIGGGSYPKPGEITLAHKGVLFLDELPEFDRKVIDSLRQPLEENTVYISRAKHTVQFPAHFILIAAMNPCPCGFHGSKQKECICSATQLLNYKRKISGPIADRIDMWIEVGEIPKKDLSEKSDSDTTKTIKDRVQKTRARQIERFTRSNLTITTNSQLHSKDIITNTRCTKEALQTLTVAAEKLMLSNRAFHRTLKLARTIADIEGSEELNEAHIFEALQYRAKISS